MFDEGRMVIQIFWYLETFMLFQCSFPETAHGNLDQDRDHRKHASSQGTKRFGNLWNSIKDFLGYVSVTVLIRYALILKFLHALHCN